MSAHVVVCLNVIRKNCMKILLLMTACVLSASSFADEIANYSFVNKTNKPHQLTLRTIKHNLGNGRVLTHYREITVPAAKGRKSSKISGQIPINTQEYYSVYWVQHHTAPEGPMETKHSTSAQGVDHYNIECEVGMNHRTTCRTK